MNRHRAEQGAYTIALDIPTGLDGTSGDAQDDTVIADRFLGNDTWRRLSETWPDPDLEDPELSIEAGARLADYINSFQPILNSAS